MLWSMGLQRVGHDLVTEQQKQFSLTTCIIHFWRAALILIHHLTLTVSRKGITCSRCPNGINQNSMIITILFHVAQFKGYNSALA